MIPDDFQIILKKKKKKKTWRESDYLFGLGFHINTEYIRFRGCHSDSGKRRCWSFGISRLVSSLRGLFVCLGLGCQNKPTM